ncbi:MAG: hypothetical protein RJA76_1271 [Bacteroidota bacterium]|jgi:uncharacterized membrane protein/mono/diheme cytochrome c family protein
MNLFENIGELHPLFVHFPISLCYILLLFELIAFKKSHLNFQPTKFILLLIAVISALLSIGLGFVLYVKEGDDGLLIQKHLWSGLATTVLIVAAFVAHYYEEIRSYRIFIFLAVVAVSLTGHFGGTLVRNEESHDEIENKSLSGKRGVILNDTNSSSNFKSDSKELLGIRAQQVLNKYCIDCHGPKKSKGKLRLDHLNFILKGGKSGPALVFGNASQSEMIRRVKLPKSDDDAMPTKGNRMLPEDIKILEDWINNSQTISNQKFKSILPQNLPALIDDYGIDKFVNVKNTNLTEDQISELTIKVRSILAHSCYSCHNATKTKGGLRLDKKEFIFKGGESGPILMAGYPEKSEIIRRIKLPEGHEDAMPTKGKRVNAEDIELLEYWIKTGASWPNGPEKSLYRVAELAPRTPKVPFVKGLKNPIDCFVEQYFQSKGLHFNQSLTDAQFIRRAYLDVIGLLPSPEETNTFVLDKNPKKREVLIDYLLNQNFSYAQHWLTFWNDLLRNDYAGPGYIDGGRSQIGHWLYASLKSNKSFDNIVRELINPTKESEGFIKGIIWRGTVNSSQSAPMQAAQNVAQVFMGLNLKCASCHDSFISDWKLEEAYGFANVFSTKTLEIHKCDLPTGKMAGYSILYPALGQINSNVTLPNRLKQLAEIFVQKKNGRLYRTFVNRIWTQMMGRGMVEPVDAMDNAPWSQDLLDWLASDFSTNGSDIKRLIRLIMTSKTYQMKPVGLKSQELLTASNFVFKGPVRRRLSAEQFSDGLSQVFQPMYTDSMIAKKSLPLEIFKEIPFARASLVKNDAFLTALGRPTRENVTTNRNIQGNLLQALELTNGLKFNKTLFDGANHWVRKYPLSEQLIKNLYQKSLGRNPNPKELNLALKYLGKKSSVGSVQDLAWAIFLLPEFQFIP